MAVAVSGIGQELAIVEMESPVGFSGYQVGNPKLLSHFGLRGEFL